MSVGRLLRREKASVARFGENFPLRQNFITPLKIYLRFLVLGKNLKILWQILYDIGQNFVVVNGQIF